MLWMLLTTLVTLVAGVVVYFFHLVAQRRAKVESQEQPDYEVKGKRKRLSSMEEILCDMHDKHGMLLLSNILFLRSKRPITEETVWKALHLLAKRHPTLRARVVKENDTNSYLEVLDEMDVPLTTSDRKIWRNLMEEQVLMKYDCEKGPLWRVCFLPNGSYESGSRDEEDFVDKPHECACIFGFHHLATDGPSYSRLFNDFLTYLHELQEGRQPVVEAMPLLPSIDHYIQDRLTETYWDSMVITLFSTLLHVPVVRTLTRVVLSQRNQYTAKFKTEIRKDPAVASRTCIVPVEFSRADTSRLLQLCKQHGATIQGAVQTASLMAMTSFLRYSNPHSKKRMNVWQRLWKVYKQSRPATMTLPLGITCNIRPYLAQCPVPNDQMGCYFLGLMQKQKVTYPIKDVAKFWKMAVDATVSIRRSISREEYYTMAKMIKFFNEKRELMEEMEELNGDPSNRRPELVVFTNLGNCSFLDRDKSSHVALRARFGCSAEHHAGAVFANNIMTFHGKMFWTVVYYQNVTGEKRATEYARLIREILKNALT